LGQIIDKMLSPIASDRYQTVHQLLQSLNPQSTSYQPTQPPTSATVTFSPPQTPAPPPVITPTPPPGIWTGTNIFIVTLAIVTSVGLLVWGFKQRGYDLNGINPITSSVNSTPAVNFSPEEKQRQQKLSDKREELNINYQFYVTLINQVFWEKYPYLKERILNDSPEDETWREQWDQIADQVLKKLSEMSSESRRQLGNYTSLTLATSIAEINKINVASRSLYDLTDVAFFREFPEQEGQKFIRKPIGQVWYGFANDQVKAILSEEASARIVFSEGTTGKTVSESLQPGKGKVFIVELTKEQNMEVKLEASPKVLLSIYSPSGKIAFLEDSQERTLSRILPETGFYEFVVVSKASEPLEYQFTIIAENPPEVEPIPTETPITPTEEPTPTETPTDEID
jgi:serine/threonine-protein kinase